MRVPFPTCETDRIPISFITAMLLIHNLLTTRITAHTLLRHYIPQLAMGSSLLWQLKIIKAEREVSQCSRYCGILQS